METNEMEPEQECTAGVRLVVLNLPEDEGDGIGFRLTRTLWDPYPWIHEVTPESRAEMSGLRAGDCLLQADGKDLLGLPIGKVAGVIRGGGEGRGVSLLVWNCGVDPRDDPEVCAILYQYIYIRGGGEGRGVSLLVWNCGVDPRDDPEVCAILYQYIYIRGGGEGRGVSLLVWNCGVDPRDDPEVCAILYQYIYIRGGGEGRGVSLLVWNCGVDPRDDPEVCAILYQYIYIRGGGEGRGVSLLVWNCGVDPRNDPEVCAILYQYIYIRGGGKGRGVSLLVWNCGVDPRDDPEASGQSKRAKRTGDWQAHVQCVPPAHPSFPACATHSVSRSDKKPNLPLRVSLERCALCREPLPPKESPYSRNLVAEQVFEAIATEYEVKNTLRRPQSTSAHTSPNRSPNISPTARRKGQYQLSMMHRNRKPTLPCEKFPSDPNINRFNIDSKSTNSTKMEYPGNSNGKCCQTDVKCKCTIDKAWLNVPQINVEDTSDNNNCNCHRLQHKLVARLRQACSLADLQNVALQSCSLSKSLNSISQNEKRSTDAQLSNSMDNLKNTDAPVFVLSPPPIYLLSCDHTQ
ncbi:uncharacterized protein LOC112048791 [Bicyclus anynana]|uniref:Uncharacterized protein LOC112048791 n=1 Tax=Bicyclus anynana TaxID=110368 RepID=A0ABM3M3C8_BICAN|nr:uncharacterized protein LOC112048791 [Bicyclus anynana]